MDQTKIGAFITERRRQKKWTQSMLAEQLGITDKAVSKWETGRSLPDLSLFPPLCGLLDITPGELLAGSLIPEQDLKQKSNEILMEVITAWLGHDNPCPSETSEEEDPILRLNHVVKTYETLSCSTTAVSDVTFQISRGSFVGIMGASGSGKSTLLNLIAAIDSPTGGTIELDGRNLAGLTEKERADFRKNHLGFIFQDYNLLDSLTVYENIALALTIKGMPKDQIRGKIAELADKFQITAVLDQFPSEISGGQRQRCACARGIAVTPALILADEPTGALDTQSARQLLDTLAMLQKEYGATILMVTHDAFAASCCDRILFMHDGKIKGVLHRNMENKQSFFTKILEKTAQLTEETNHVS